MNVLSGNFYILWIDVITPLTDERGNPEYYRPVVCGVSNGVNLDIESISTRNKCDGGFDQSESGYISWSFDLDGFAVGLRNSEASVKANFQELADLALNKVKFWAKQEDAETSVTREGRVRIGSFKEVASLDAPYSFTASFIGIGRPIFETNIYKTVIATDDTALELLEDGEDNLIETTDGN